MLLGIRPLFATARLHTCRVAPRHGPAVRDGVGAGAGEGARMEPSHHARTLIADGRRGVLAQLDERRAFALAAPNFEGVRLHAKDCGSLLVAEQVVQINRCGHS